MGTLFDPDDAFSDDYLFFCAEELNAERSEEDAAVAIERAGLAEGMRVLDAPCGYGRVAVRLAQHGLSVTGVDRSTRFLELGRTAASSGGVDVAFFEGDLRDLPVDGPFDAVVCWSTSFGYFDDEDNLAVLREFRRVLRPGGVLLVETLSHDGYVRTFTEEPEAVVVEVDGAIMVDRNTFDANHGRVVCHRVTLREGSQRSSRFAIRLLTVPEWHRALADAGFAQSTVTDLDGEPIDVATWRLVVRAVA